VYTLSERVDTFGYGVKSGFVSNTMKELILWISLNPMEFMSWIRISFALKTHTRELTEQ